MALSPAAFAKLMVGAFAFAILGFFVRGFSQLAVGSETAELLAAPIFLVAIGLAIVAFILSVLAKLGIIADPTTEN